MQHVGTSGVWPHLIGVTGEGAVAEAVSKGLRLLSTGVDRLVGWSITGTFRCTRLYTLLTGDPIRPRCPHIKVSLPFSPVLACRPPIYISPACRPDLDHPTARDRPPTLHPARLSRPPRGLCSSSHLKLSSFPDTFPGPLAPERVASQRKTLLRPPISGRPRPPSHQTFGSCS